MICLRHQGDLYNPCTSVRHLPCLPHISKTSSGHLGLKQERKKTADVTTTSRLHPRKITSEDKDQTKKDDSDDRLHIPQRPPLLHLLLRQSFTW